MQMNIVEILEILKKERAKWNTPAKQLAGKTGKDPFKVLVAALLSSRTKDEVTAKAVERLFKVADTPEKVLKLSEDTIASLIYPVGFYKVKAKRLKELSGVLIERFGGKVPCDLEKLLSLPGVGRKTANLVLARAFNKPAVCVDTHVHRIMNRLGYIRTSSPKETEEVLQSKLPQRYWAEVNGVLVSFGQKVCTPVSPHCSVCPVEKTCRKVGVKRAR
jgi:endonuclease-3